MAGNSQRRGAVRKTNKKGASAGTGGQRRKSLKGKGPTPKAEARKGHKAYKATTATKRTPTAKPRERKSNLDVVVGRNPVVEALRSEVPASVLHVATGIDYDERR